MNPKILNLGLLALWLGIFVGLLTRDHWMTPEMVAKVNSPNTPLVVAATGMLALWNAVRLWHAFKFKAPPKTARQRLREKLGETPKVTDPQFTFDDPPKG